MVGLTVRRSSWSTRQRSRGHSEAVDPPTEVVRR